MRNEVLISADTHVGETEDLRARLPEKFRRYLQRLVPAANGDLDLEIAGKIVEFDERNIELSDHDRELEFRSDPSFGTDLDRRMCDMAREGVDAQVVFPNLSLDCGGGRAPSEYTDALALAYNDFVMDVFSDQPKRFKPAGMIPVDHVGRAVEEEGWLDDIWQQWDRVPPARLLKQSGERGQVRQGQEVLFNLPPLPFGRGGPD